MQDVVAMRNRRVQSEGRRRRVLRDDLAPKSSSGSRSRSRGGGRLQLYVEDAITHAQPRITDFIPRRKYGLLVWLLLCMIPPALVQALYIWRDSYFQGAWLQDSTALKLVGASTIATWCSSMLLMFTALIAMTIYCVRRHKLDDYRGRYRLWLWTAALCALCSLDTVAALHRPVKSIMLYFTKTPLWGDGSIWWMIVLGSVISVVLLRVVLDVRRSRGTLLFLAISITCYASATLFYLRVFRIGPGEVDMMAYVASLMTAHVFLMFSLLVYARFVCREAAGEYSSIAPRKKRERTGSWFSRRSSSRDQGKASSSKPKRKKRPNDQPPEVDDDYEEVDDEDLGVVERPTDPESSKSDQRKLRKKKRQQRHAA